MTVTAWIVPLTNTVSAAVGEFELIHILTDAPVLFTLPRTPSYCQQVFVWNNKIIPLMNLVEKFALEDTATNNRHIIVSIFAYRAKKIGHPEYGALLLNATPYRREVSDEQACQLPLEFSAWSGCVWSCFQDVDTQKTIPILKLEQLFGNQAGI